ncbi:MAG: DUF4159 domain-containing protein [Planctomycetota bacterium]|nr:DUF4159 domain-containing protein [Planctomycetota bacterium]
MSFPLKCSRCGATIAVQPPTPQSPPLNLPPLPQPPPPRPKTLWLVIASISILALALAILIPILVRQSHKRADERYWLENFDKLVALKADAERLAIAGSLPEAHAVYRQIERIVGGRTPADPRLWDLAERAKQDQDRLYSIILDARASLLSPQPASAPEKPTPPAQYRGLNQPPLAAADPPPSSSAPRSLLAAATQAFTPTTQPLAIQPIAPAPTIPPTAPPIRAVALQPTDSMDAQIGQAIQRGTDFLVKQLEADQIAISGKPNDTHLEGLNALCVYALLQASQTCRDERLDPKNPFMKGLINRMKEHMYVVDSANPVGPVTYAHSLRALALSVYNRPEDRQTLKDEVKWLIMACTDGAYTYNDRAGRIYKDNKLAPSIAPSPNGKTLYYFDPQESSQAILLHNGEKYVPAPPRQPAYPFVNIRPNLGSLYRNRLYSELPDIKWDNSNTQYALLGVWAGAEVGIEVPLDYWMDCEQHWMQWQTGTGEWAYNNSPTAKPSFAMTTAGIASLFVTHDYLDAPALNAELGRNPFSQSLARGLAWLEKSDNSVNITAGGMQCLGYNLYGLERVGLASGFKYFGTHDWYRELAAKVLALQRPDGSWCRDLAFNEGPDDPSVQADALIDTAYVVLFLCRGRHPVMINKLRFDGFWANRPREIANLSKFASRELERPLNWQIVSLQSDWFDWLDAPILYLASHQTLKLQPADLQKLRSFAEAGGLILTHSDASAAPFNIFINDLAKKLFPEYELTNLPPSHELYSLMYKIQTKPPLKAITNGSRLLLVHSPTDLSTAWQVRNGLKRENWELAINLFVYAAGKTDFRNRLNTLYISPNTGRSATSVRFARLKYPTAWNPEPFAFERFNHYLRQHTSLGLDLVTLDVRDLKPESAPIAHLTGNVPYTPTDPDLTALRNYVQSGGILLIDSCGGSERFSQSVAALLQKLAPTQKPTLMGFKHRLFTPALPAMDDLTRPQLRPYAKLPPQFQTLTIGKGKVISTPLDLTTGLLGTNTWCISGYKPDYSQKFLKNLVLWTSDGAKN